MSRKDVEDDRGAIDHALPGAVLESALLPWRQLVVADDEIRREARALGADIRELALPHPSVRVGCAALLDHAARHLASRSLHQRGELIEGIGGIETRARLIEADEEGALRWLRGVFHSDSVAGSGSSAVGSIQWIAGSRRNHVICRREYRRVSRIVSVIASSSVVVPRRCAAQ